MMGKVMHYCQTKETNKTKMPNETANDALRVLDRLDQHIKQCWIANKCKYIELIV